MTRLGRIALGLMVALTAAYLMLPSLVVIPMSLTSGRSLSFPPDGLSLRWYQELLDDPSWLQAFFNSVKVALLTAVCATVLGTAAALGLHRSRLRGTAAVALLVRAPLAVPYVVLGIALYAVFLRWGLTSTLLGFVLAHTVLAIPYVVMSVLPLLGSLDEGIEKAAATLGATPATVFRSVTLPALVPGMITGAFFSFIISFDEVVVAIFLGGVGFETLPLRMWSGVRVSIEPTIAAVATVLVLTSTLVLLAGYTGRALSKQIVERRSRKVTA
ncbi:putative spermidine/putrescine transport system permease protein [Nocardioides marinisabuli]|uniref:Putative spermidine/putrescine transport system permease protein n=1 Tax=Nocardioides marinisabuli TaxID=419476 RepID=A0A7Y9F0Y7_9ACTN|nr:ABC transporter permease [Nocardioides marinisabuli]NYD57597.1 putative spermidine/putrescine transport system permease protein [Nocardioides marinisabuli]